MVCWHICSSVSSNECSTRVLVMPYRNVAFCFCMSALITFKKAQMWGWWHWKEDYSTSAARVGGAARACDDDGVVDAVRVQDSIDFAVKLRRSLISPLGSSTSPIPGWSNWGRFVNGERGPETFKRLTNPYYFPRMANNSTSSASKCPQVCLVYARLRLNKFARAQKYTQVNSMMCII